MTEKEIKNNVAETGRILLKKKLVARTWGNFSQRIDETHFAITPSGLGYETLAADDVPVFNMKDETWEGRKPSSEKRIHAECYKNFPDVNFVVHTHQDFATAVGLVGTENLKLTNKEKELLGNVELASYGLPGTKKLVKGVASALHKGSKTILMIHHGAIILGKDREDAIHKAEVLETVCKRAVEEKIGNTEEMLKTSSLSAEAENILTAIRKKFPNARIVNSKLMLKLAETGGITTQLDDMSQMIGSKLKAVDNRLQKIMELFEKRDAVLVKGIGCVIKADDPDDVDALEILITKSGISKLYTDSCQKKIKLGSFDCALMHMVFKLKYSKKKNEKANKEKEKLSPTELKEKKKKEFWRFIKFFLCSASAGVIELVSEALMERCIPWERVTENTQIRYWISYMVAVILSVIWNFTLNRKFTFKSATNVPIAMLKIAGFYAVFIPASTVLNKVITDLNWGAADDIKGTLATGICMILDFTCEYLFDRFIVFGKSLDTSTDALKDKKK